MAVKDKLCKLYRVCLVNSLDDFIEREQASIRIHRGVRLTKQEVAEEVIHQWAKEKGVIK